MTRAGLQLLASAGLASAVLLAGCGGGGTAVQTVPSTPPLTKAGYQAKVRQIVSSVSARYGTVPTNPASMSNADLGKAEQALRALADRLEQVRPPEEVAEFHEEYADALRSLAAELPVLTAKMGDDPSTGLDVLLSSKAVQALLRVAQSFSEKGYDLDRKE